MTILEGTEGPEPLSGATAPEPPVDPLLGAAVLIVEDNAFIGAALEEMLAEQGLEVVGVAKSVKQALRLAAAPRVDLGLLDVNVGDQRIDPVAEALQARGVPFIFATGYGRAGLPEAFRDRPVVEKPFYTEEILRTLRHALRKVQAERE
ncbi:MAG TPA: response regulator [Methylocystis sp.]|nr:response regulator [Methylocystis sp.]